MKEKIIYLADISDDIDDLLAIEYLVSLGRISGVVLDGKSRNEERESLITKTGIPIFFEIPEGTKTVFCGGAFTKIAEYLKLGGKLDLVVANGFFAGSNIVPEKYILPKFKNKEICRSYNPELDIAASLYLINSGTKCLIVSKNVCHSPKNIMGEWHKETFDCRPNKLLHDVLMVKEGLALVDGCPLLCEYAPVYIELVENKWRSVRNDSSNISISLFYKE